MKVFTLGQRAAGLATAVGRAQRGLAAGIGEIDGLVARFTVYYSQFRNYVALTKPRIISLLLITALGGMFLAAKGVPHWTLILVVLGGGALASGGANALNHYMDRDIDEQMVRTRKRPLARGAVKPRNALIFGVALNLGAFALLFTYANLLSALLTLCATLFYIIIYTGLLKRSTPQNIVIGGAAGSIPPLVGWAAVTGNLGLPAFFLFAVIFFWTPPHFWALALLLKDDYARAGIPMLPVVAGVDKTKKQIFLYTLLVVALAIAFLRHRAVECGLFGRRHHAWRRLYLLRLAALEAAGHSKGEADVPLFVGLPCAPVFCHNDRQFAAFLA